MQLEWKKNVNTKIFINQGAKMIFFFKIINDDKLLFTKNNFNRIY
jgi:hypothetical protein